MSVLVKHKKIKGQKLSWHVIEGNVTQIFELNILTVFSDEDIVVAQHDFQPASDSDLQFKKGDRLKIIKE